MLSIMRTYAAAHIRQDMRLRRIRCVCFADEVGINPRVFLARQRTSRRAKRVHIEGAV